MKILTISTAFLAAIFLAGVAVNYVGADSEVKPRSADCPNFVDADGDGVNDSCSNGGVRPQDGTGKRQRAGRGNGGANPDCPNFIDADGDGINDNCPNDGVRPQDGTGKQKRLRRGRSGGSGEAKTRCGMRIGRGRGMGRRARRVSRKAA